MSNKLPNRIPLKDLTIISGRLFLLFLFGALLISSLQVLSLAGLTQRLFSLGSLFIVIFSINVLVFHYFDKRRKSNLDRVWKKVYIIGYVFNFLYFSVHISIFAWLEQKGLYQFPNDRIDIESFSGLRYFTFLIGASSVIHTFIFLIQNAVLTQHEKSQMQMELLQLEAANADAVNQLLRQQIQPHFLFNALNILKSLIKRDSKRAENYLLHLSDFLRVSISKNTSGVSSIEEELKICNDYMEMQRIRFGEALQYNVNIPDLENIKNRKLPFFSLQLLLENAIKHNKLTDASPLFMEIKLEGEYITVCNNLQERNDSEISTGNGLTMLQQRYRILNEEAPIIKRNGSTFSVFLKILEDEHSNH